MEAVEGADQRAAVIQGLTYKSELPGLLGFLRAACRDPLQTESFVSFETVYATTVDRRQRAVALLHEFTERMATSTETADPFRFPFDARAAAKLSPRVAAKRALVYEERDVRSSTEALVRRRVVTPTPTPSQGQHDDDAMARFLEFQGCAKRSQLARRGVRCPLHEGVWVSIFSVQKPPGEVDRPGLPPAATCPFPEDGGDLLLVEIEAPVKEAGGDGGGAGGGGGAGAGGGGLLPSIEAAKEAAAVLQDFIVQRKRT